MYRRTIVNSLSHFGMNIFWLKEQEYYGEKTKKTMIFFCPSIQFFTPNKGQKIIQDERERGNDLFFQGHNLG